MTNDTEEDTQLIPNKFEIQSISQCVRYIQAKLIFENKNTQFLNHNTTIKLINKFKKQHKPNNNNDYYTILLIEILKIPTEELINLYLSAKKETTISFIP